MGQKNHGIGSTREVFNKKWKKYTVITCCVVVLAGASYLLITTIISPQVAPMSSVSDDTDRMADAIRSSKAVSSYNLSVDKINSYNNYGDGWNMANVTFSDANNTGKTTYDIILRESDDGSYSIVIDIDEDVTNELMEQRNVPESIRKEFEKYNANNDKGDHE